MVLTVRGTVIPPLVPLVIGISGGIIGVFIYHRVRDVSKLVLFRYFPNTKRFFRKVEDDTPQKPVRIWLDGVFDLMHFGHANAFRQARALGTELIVGVNSDAEVIANKGPPVYNEQERMICVKACKWVDQVVADVPYVMNEAYLDMIFEKYDVDYVVHGDDPCLTADGQDVYASAKARDKFKFIKRTEGVSTTDIVGRMLLMTRDHFAKENEDMDHELVRRYSDMSEVTSPSTSFTRVSSFLPTTWRFNQFSSGKMPKPGDRIVYINGAWDMFHAAHVEILRKAHELGDFLLVGVMSDQDVNRYRGLNYPILNLHERTLSVLSCRYTDEVIIGCPLEVTMDLVTTMGISIVAHGNIADQQFYNPDRDPFAVARELGIFREVDCDIDISTSDIVERILHNKEMFVKKHDRKSRSESKYLQEKSYVAEI
eukprot:JP435748.1.p1 GENE.JP435748.1~~JP435748.1.p1  ORF type:complete len:437 (-),score=102.38 JP435748.1:241-1521(-)